MKYLEKFRNFEIISENLKYHLEKEISLIDNVFRPGSQAYFDLIKESRKLFDSGFKLKLNENERYLFENTDIGYFTYYEGELVPLDLPMLNETNQPTFSIHDVTPDFEVDVMGRMVKNIKPLSWVKNKKAPCMEFEGELDGLPCKCKYDDDINAYIFEEAKYKGKEVDLNKPMRSSGPKKYKVYVRDPKSGNVKVVNFGDIKGGLSAKINDPKARKSFASRHRCHLKKDKTKPGYWACRANRYPNLWGGKTYPGYW
jgi:hypothetical protein